MSDFIERLENTACGCWTWAHWRQHSFRFPLSQGQGTVFGSYFDNTGYQSLDTRMMKTIEIDTS